MSEHSVLPLKADPGMPARSPLAMPIQDLTREPKGRRRGADTRSARAARFVAFGGAALLAAAGANEMIQVVSIGGTTVLEGLMTAIFVATFAWIAFAACTAVAGALFAPRRGRTTPEHRIQARIALVMPIYHEDPRATTAALRVMAEGLQSLGEASAFEIVVLSDSTSADAWVAETLAVDRLRAALSGVMPVWYRRRWRNSAKKAGNLKNFVEQWGGRYEYFIVLDADSLMTPATLVELAAAMQGEPDLGLLQTLPVVMGGRTLFARLQQFAARIHGPIVGRGVAAWQGSDGNYWGHNAIIRMRAFAECCGLPELAGREPFGGPILSHDFVEAALMRRAGWRVEMDAHVGGSFEASPPSLIDAAARDRRWAQGNLQHSKVIAARGLSLVSRAHLAIGIISYWVSPLWLLLIACGFALSLQATLIRPEYFSNTFQLFPSWPHFDSERMVRLFVLTMMVLLLPKAMGLARALARPQLRRGCGGGLRLFASFLVEIVVSMLLAPVMMVVHSRQIYEILLGRDAGWSPQRREDNETRWSDAWRGHRWHMICGIAMAVAAWFLSPAILVWLLPTLTGLLLAVPLSRASGSARVGAALQRVGLLTTPEERDPPAIVLARDAAIESTPPLPADGVAALASDASALAAHYRWVSSPPRTRGAPEPALLTASEKVQQAQSLPEALAWLDPRERVYVAGHRIMAEHLRRLAADDGPELPAIRPAAPPQLDLLAEQAHMRPPAA